LNHNLFSVCQFCDADLEVAFGKSTCFIRDLKGNDLLTGSRGTDLYSITLQDTDCPNLICLMAKATLSQAWLWHRRLSHLNFDTINLLSKNDIVVGLPKSKDETLEVLIDFLRLVQRGLQAQVRVVRTDKGTEFLNQTLHVYFAAEGILYQTSVARTPEQNGVVKRRNRHFKTSMAPRTGGSILSLIDELVKVGQVMGYKMDGCMSNMTEIIKSQGVKEVNFLALQETKMENMELFSVKMCWGNFVFDYVRGVWRETGNVLLIIAVYAPHDLKDRFGSVFNVQGANVFNSFITNAGLEEVPLGGSSFTWCHKSANKMSKLDRFLISENLLNTCPNITAITFERYLSDHRPVLLRESHFDYGPTPFRFFHHWIEMEVEYDDNVKEKYKNELEALEAIIDKGDGNVKVVNKRMKIDKICSSEMAQKAKVKWSIEGDENTSFFHGMLNKKWSLLNIRGIMVDGMWIESPNRVKGEIFHHFSSKFDKPDARRAYIEMRYPKTLTCDQQVELESGVSNEIKRAVWDYGIDKSPGQDGFTFGFYRRFSNLIENDVYDAVKYFFTYGVIPKGCNSSFIALIPKIPDATTVKDFRPISLIGSLCKIVAKFLANCLVGVLGDIVNEVQSAFIAGRQILNSPFILNEVLQWYKIKNKQSLIFKVDFKKAYDSVRWDFLDDILKNFEFGEKWCIKLSSSLSISHMFYADDAVFVGQWCDGNIATLVHVLECFYRVSGLRINMSKSKIMGVLVDSDKVKCDASKLGCLILKTLFSYLGSKVGGSMSRVHTWNEAIHGDDGKVGGYVKDGAKSCWLSIVNEINSLKNKALKNRYPRIYSLETCKLITVGMKLAHTSLDSSFRRVSRGGVEQEQFDELSALVIDDKSLPEVDSKTRWIKYVPIKVNVHAWKVKTDSLPTRFNVSRRGIHIDSIMCAICDKGAETSSHLFFSCCMARQTVRMITRWWDVPYGEVDSFEDWINWFVNLRLSYKHKQMLEGVFYVKW
nr:RNA-directed DNA polymerase, eukaryota [Tanacetum cinerariifolium]